MPAGILSINGYDAYKRWGISMKQTGLTALMTPSAVKARIENKYRKLDGKKVLNTDPRLEPRDLTLEIHMFAKDEKEFYLHYEDFCNNVLAKGQIDIVTSYQRDKIYRCYYVSCSQFSEFISKYASFSLRLEEPDPTKRTMTTEEYNAQFMDVESESDE